MTYEATIVELLGKNGGGDPVLYTCAVGYAGSKGTLMELSGNRGMVSHVGSATPFVGVLSQEAVSGTFAPNIHSVYTNGIFDVKFAGDGATDLGHMCCLGSNANECMTAAAGELLSYAVVGQCYEAASNGETATVRIRK